MEHSTDNLQLNYFSTWIWSAIHFLTSIPEYQSLENISDRLGLKLSVTLQFLEQLQTQGLIENQGQRWIYKSGEFHAPKDSPLVRLHHQNWRMRAVVDAQDLNSEGTHFTAVQTVSKNDYEKIKNLLLQFISEASSIAGPSTPEEGIVITCDVFKI